MMLDIDGKFLAFGFSRLSFSLFTFSRFQLSRTGFKFLFQSQNSSVRLRSESETVQKSNCRLYIFFFFEQPTLGTRLYPS